MVDLVPNARQVFVDQNGAPLVGGSVFMYVPGTTIPKTTWQDQAGTVPNTNPIVLDALGSAAILGQGLYRQIVQDAAGDTIWDALTNPPGELTATGTNAGCVVWFTAAGPPGGFLECNGQAVSRSQYNLLFAAIGTIWGSGDGSSTFNVPDLRGYFIRGWDDGADRDTGRVFGSTQTDAVNQADISLSVGTLAVSGTIAGTLTLPGNPGAGVGAESGGQNIGKDGTYTVTVPSGALTPTLVLSGEPTLTAQAETRPINVALLPCISTGAGPGFTTGGQITYGLTQINHGSSPYTIQPTDSVILCDSSAGGIQINPPASPVAGKLIIIKDLTGHAGTNPITFNFTVDGSAAYSLAANYDCRNIISVGGTTWAFLT